MELTGSSQWPTSVLRVTCLDEKYSLDDPAPHQSDQQRQGVYVPVELDLRVAEGADQHRFIGTGRSCT